MSGVFLRSMIEYGKRMGQLYNLEAIITWHFRVQQKNLRQ